MSVLWSGAVDFVAMKQKFGEKEYVFCSTYPASWAVWFCFFPFWLVGNGKRKRKMPSLPELKPNGFCRYAFENAFLSCVSLNKDGNSTFCPQKTAECGEGNFLNPLGTQKWSDYFEVCDDLTLPNLPSYTKLGTVELCSKAPRGGWGYFFAL